MNPIASSSISNPSQPENLEFSRTLTSPLRLLPDFIIIGAQKCGTTSLYAYLTQHPCIRAASRKEVHFFDENFDQGLNWYRRQFPTIFRRFYQRRISKQTFLTGESSPYYIFHPLVPQRILEILPTVKLIVLLRNPIDRAYSHYHHNVVYGRESLSFEAAIAQEAKRLQGEPEKILADPHYHSFNHKHYSYLSKGIYVDQLQTWFSLFSPEQILVLSNEDLSINPALVFQQTLEFLKAPQWQLPQYPQYHANQYQSMSESTRQYLAEYFKPHNQRLYEYLGQNFNWH